MGTRTIILASVLGGTGLILLLVLFLLTLFLRRRRCQKTQQQTSYQPGRDSATSWATFRASGGHDTYHLDRAPRTSETRTIRPLTPSPSRLSSTHPSTATSLTITRTPPFLATVVDTRWDLEKANAAATTPPGHPATTMMMMMPPSSSASIRRRRRPSSVSRVAAGLHFAAGGEHEYHQHHHHHDAHMRQCSQNSTISSTERRQQQQQQPYLVPLPLLPHHYFHPLSPPPSHPPPPPLPIQPQPPQQEESISSTFAAEMSSLLDSISFKSSYSSLRSGGTGDRSSTAASSSGHGPMGLSAPPPIHRAATVRGPS